jgi:N-acetyl-beta-hexosaminidase
MEELAHYKMNVFHLHLTDYTAWRMEVRSHPELTRPEFQTRQPGKIYTQAQIRELIEFCRQRHIMVVPEIDMPGHSTAFRNATGHDMQSSEGMAILRDVLAEVVEIFDAPYIHLSADELREIDQAASQIEVHGARYPEHLQKMVGR